jgi:hypothetical protein
LGSFTTTAVFTVIPIGVPAITSFQPTSGLPGSFVQFFGTNLVGVRSVLFNGTPARTIMGGARPDGYLEAVVPPQATSGPITIVTDAGSGTSIESFTVLVWPRPVITGFSPESAAPGSRITITGSNFLSLESVAFSGVVSRSSYLIDAGISAEVPFVSSGLIKVVTAGGTAISSNLFTVIGGPPPLSAPSFTPHSGPTGTQVMITGMNLERVSGVSFSGIAAAFKAYGDQILAVVPPAAQDGPITVQTPLGQALTQETFTTFNSGDLALTTQSSVSSLVADENVTFSVRVTNTTPIDIEQLVLTNSFASGTTLSAALIISDGDIPVFNGLPPADLEIVSAQSSSGSYTMTNGTLAFNAGTLVPGASASFEVTVKAHSLVHSLAVCSGTRADSGRTIGSAIASVAVLGPNRLLIQRSDPGHLELRWPALGSPGIIQSSQKMAPLLWSDANLNPAVTNGGASIVLPTTGASQFFRLRSNSP